jgi:hypothetical protein
MGNGKWEMGNGKCVIPLVDQFRFSLRRYSSPDLGPIGNRKGQQTQTAREKGLAGCNEGRKQQVSLSRWGNAYGVSLHVRRVLVLCYYRHFMLALALTRNEL